jgi:putative ABC transport system ATP-binding protein
MNTSAPAVSLRGLSKSYAEAGTSHTILERLDADFAAGEFVLLLGKSGSGKSTLLNLVSGIDTPTSGEVTVAGTPLHRLSERQRTLFRRDHIGIVFQFFNLIPTLTVLENVTLPSELGGRPIAASRKHAEALLEQVGLGSRLLALPDRLSGGEQQRVAIARALCHSPDLVLADEPTGNLDGDTGQRVLELLLTLTRSAGKTLIMASHSSDIISRADRVYRVHAGRLSPEPSSGAGG